jgi:AcrR family transcriptional regulator
MYLQRKCLASNSLDVREEGPDGGGETTTLSRRRVLEEAVRFTDREGLEALTMRRLGSELGVEAMSLYNHIPNKSALLDGMVEVCWGS